MVGEGRGREGRGRGGILLRGLLSGANKYIFSLKFLSI